MKELSYTKIPNPPPPMQWKDYEEIVSSKWSVLLSSIQKGEEKRVQEFLETHPCMIPGAFSFPVSSGHYPFPAAVISQPPLRGLKTKIPDFMWLATDSGTLHIVFVEIESPLKKWFTSEGNPHSDFTQAQTQLVSWKQWFEVNENRALFSKIYKIPPELQEKSLNLVFILIYGRRQEFEDKPILNARRKYLEHPNEYLMTFDRLSPGPKADALMCVRLVESVDGPVYEALSIPPTLRLGPDLAGDHSIIRKRDIAINRNQWISLERKQFLSERFPYWDKWAKAHKGYYIGGYKE